MDLVILACPRNAAGQYVAPELARERKVTAAARADPMADPLPNGNRLPVDPSLARATVDAMVKLLGQLSDGRRGEPARQEAREAARALHLELAGAEFDSRLPAKAPRERADAP